jgi:hypothetical protein
MLDIESPSELTVQSHSVTHLVHQFNAIDSPRAPRGAANFVHELEKDARALLRHQTEAGIDAKMHYREALVRRAHENGDSDRPALIRNCEERLDAFYVADTDPQAAVLLVDFGHAIGVDGLLDADADTMLVNVEKQQLLQGWTLLRG